MFTKIRYRLTMSYSVVMMLFLMAFILTSYTGLVWVLYREEQQDVRAFAEEEAREHVSILQQRESLAKPELKEEDEEFNGKIFYYAFDINGRQVSASEPASEVRTAVLENIRNWQAFDGEARLAYSSLPNGEKFVFMMCRMKISNGQRTLGTIFVGKDITSYYEMLKTLLLVLSVVSLLFLVIATLAGHILAGRAIIPIKQSLLRQREFVADASHELRTPLSIMLSSVDAIQSDDGNNLSPFSIQVLDDMKGEIKRMSRIVSDLLTLARADAGANDIIKEKFDLCLVAKQVIRSLQPLANEKEIKLKFTGTDSLFVYADKEKVNQLLLILLDNAIKYTPCGGQVDLFIKLMTSSKRSVMITVHDTGIGIPAEQQQLIFERFYRVDKIRSREEGGTGLGLSIAHWIAEAHGGTIKVESTPGVGSSFIVTIPV